MERSEFNKLLGNRIRDARKAKNITLLELGKLVGISESTVKRYEDGSIKSVSIDMLKKFSAALNIQPADLMGWDTPPQKNIPTFNYIHIPVGIAAGALETCEGLMDLPTVNLPDFLLGKYARNKNIVIMHVNGESMNKVIQNGSTIAVLTGLALENVHDGDIVVAATDRGEYTIKHFIDDKKNSRIILRPDSTDSSFADLPFSYEEAQSIKIFGKVVIYSVNL